MKTHVAWHFEARAIRKRRRPRCRLELPAIRSFLKDLVIHASCEALHQVIATTKEVRAGSPADQQCEESHVRAWPLVEDSQVCTEFIVRCLRVMKIHVVCLLEAMDAIGAKRSMNNAVEGKGRTTERVS